MVTTYLISIIVERREDLWNTLSLAALLILLFSPSSLFDISFQLSFVSVMAILYIAPPCSSFLFQHTQDPLTPAPVWWKDIARRIFLFLTITIAAFVEITYEMVLYEQGPAVQDTTYTETIDGDDYTIDIDSIRVIGFDPEPDWASRVRLSYEFETAMFANERLHEQRRPLRTRVRRGLRATYLTTDVEAQKLRNMLMYGHDKTFACPIYAEKLDVVTCTQGTSSIVFSSSTTDKWNLNTQCDRVILVDHENGQNEIKTIDSIAANSIVTSSDIQRAFVPASTLCYPIFIGTLKTAQERYHSNSVLETILTFEEYFGGG